MACFSATCGCNARAETLEVPCQILDQVPSSTRLVVCGWVAPCCVVLCCAVYRCEKFLPAVQPVRLLKTLLYAEPVPCLTLLAYSILLVVCFIAFLVPQLQDCLLLLS
jgi:hypothetical protein